MFQILRRRSHPGQASVLPMLRNKWVAAAAGLAVLAALGVGPVIYRQHSEAAAKVAKAQAASDARRRQAVAPAGRIHDRAVIASHEAARAAHDDATTAHASAVKVFATLDAANARTTGEYILISKKVHTARSAAINSGRAGVKDALELATTAWLAADAAFKAGAVAVPVAQTTPQAAVIPCVAATRAALAANAASPTGRALAHAGVALFRHDASSAGRALARAEATLAVSPASRAWDRAEAANNASPTGRAWTRAEAALAVSTPLLTWRAAEARAGWGLSVDHQGSNFAAGEDRGSRDAEIYDTSTYDGAVSAAALAAATSPTDVAAWIAEVLNDASPTGVAFSKSRAAYNAYVAGPAGDAWRRTAGLYTGNGALTRAADKAADKAAAANAASPTWAAVMKASCRSGGGWVGDGAVSGAKG